MLSAKLLICFIFQSASMSSKVAENVVWVSNSLDMGEKPSYSASHPDSSCLHMELQLCSAGYWLNMRDPQNNSSCLYITLSSQRFRVISRDLCQLWSILHQFIHCRVPGCKRTSVIWSKITVSRCLQCPVYRPCH